MSGDPQSFDAERHIDAMAPTMGLAITAAQRPGVARFLRIARAMAAQLEQAPVDPDTIELAPVFTPGAASNIAHDRS